MFNVSASVIEVVVETKIYILKSIVYVGLLRLWTVRIERWLTSFVSCVLNKIVANYSSTKTGSRGYMNNTDNVPYYCSGINKQNTQSHAFDGKQCTRNIYIATEEK